VRRRPAQGPGRSCCTRTALQFEKSFNIADITNTSNTEGALIAATFAAQGYIVVAPNYAGYDMSTLGYHPFLNASQQSGEMIDALTAARTALPTTYAASTTDSGKLFITGYSEGGYVAMATERALELAGKPVTAAAPMSGPYALEALFDAAFFGDVNLGSTLFTPLVTTSYQHRLRQHLHDDHRFLFIDLRHRHRHADADDADAVQRSVYAGSAAADRAVRQHYAGRTRADRAAGGTEQPGQPADAAVRRRFRFTIPDQQQRACRLRGRRGRQSRRHRCTGSVTLAARAPTYGLRLDLYKNDMRNGSWAPTAPTLLCGGENDPTVFFSVDTLTMAAFWSAVPTSPVTVLDVDPAAGPSGPYALIQGEFQASQVAEFAYLESTGLTATKAQEELVQLYHGTSVPPFCSLAARTFFDHF
jgi:dienelactone hydrolase